MTTEKMVSEALDGLAGQLHDLLIEKDDLGAQDALMWQRIRGALDKNAWQLTYDANTILKQERDLASASSIEQAAKAEEQSRSSVYECPDCGAEVDVREARAL